MENQQQNDFIFFILFFNVFINSRIISKTFITLAITSGIF